MYLVRPARLNDLDDLLSLAKQMAPGITTFPPDRDVLQALIERSVATFSDDTHSAQNNSYLLVLEDCEKTKAIGTAGVYADIGAQQPFYSFKTITQTQMSYDLSLKNTTTTLNLTNAFQGGTEVGTLLLDKSYAKLGLGKLLAKSRYLLIKLFNQRFNDPVFAELRGWTDASGESPFWNAIGAKFFPGVTFDQADLLSATTNNQFIADMMPKTPIYVDLLPDQAQQALANVNTQGRAAFEMLIKEGFRDEGYIDIFDGGITVVCNMAELETIKHATIKQVQSLSTEHSQNDIVKLFLANPVLNDFRVVIETKYQFIGDSIHIPETTQTLLGLSNNQNVCCLAI